MRFLRTLAALALAALPGAALADTIYLNTGSAPYTVTSPNGSTQNAIITTVNPGWTAPPPTNGGGTAQWINTSGSGSSNDPAGQYVYSSSAFVASSNVSSIHGFFSSDNASSAILFDLTTNTFTTLASNSYSSPFSFAGDTEFSALLTQGNVYRLQFDVMNGNGGSDGVGPTGLLAGVEATDVTPTPEPSSLVLLGTGILGTAAAMRRKFVRV